MTEPYRVLLDSLWSISSGSYFTSDDWHDAGQVDLLEMVGGL